MARIERFRIPHDRKMQSIVRHISEADAAGVIMNELDGANGRTVVVDGQRLLNFGSCSYLALEARPELREMAHRAIDEYGTQVHFSRAFLECPLYRELEAALTTMAGRPVVVAASTTLGHLSALPALIGDEDYVFVDQFAHASLHMALELVRHAPLEIIRHNRMDQLEAQLERLGSSHEKIWYIADGLYSMLGDFCPFEELSELLERYPRLHLYVDDAHSTSWLGAHGRGAALEHWQDAGRVVVTLSLNKAFSAAGAAIALPTEAAKKRLRHCGGPMVFSGPIQPPLLGAAVASARLHLSSEFPKLQAELTERIELCRSAMDRFGILTPGAGNSPIFQLACDSPRAAFRLHRRLRERGYYCCVCTFPAVPMNRPGLRFTVTRHNELEDIEPFVREAAASLDYLKRAAAKSAVHDHVP